MSAEASRLMDLDEMGTGMSPVQIRGSLKEKQRELEGLMVPMDMLVNEFSV